MYDTVPTTMPAIVTCGCVSRAASAPSGLTNLASPKSSTLTSPRSVRIRLALLTSRCTIPRLCASSSASVTCRPISTTSRIASGPFATRDDSSSPSTYSITMKSAPLDSPMS